MAQRVRARLQLFVDQQLHGDDEAKREFEMDRGAAARTHQDQGNGLPRALEALIEHRLRV